MRHMSKRRGCVALWTLLSILLAGCSTSGTTNDDEQASKVQTAEPAESEGPDRIILLIGDGMGASAQTAATYAAGRPLAMTTMPYLNFITTHSWQFVTTDSAASATAFSTGHKTHYEGVSVEPGTTKEQETDPAFQLRTLIEEAESRDWKTGLVATARITHATPAAFAAHRANRDSYQAIADDLRGSGVDVLLGGGRRHFAQRDDGRDLLAGFRDDGYTVVDDAAGVRRARKTSDRLIGLLDRKDPPPMQADEPRKMSLGEMTSSALSVLDRNNDEGFFLMVEGSQIDWEGHDLDGPGVIEETLDFDRAVARALEYARDREDTLVVTVADHETGGLGVYDDQAAERYLEALGGRKKAESKVAYSPKADTEAPAAVAQVDVGDYDEHGASMTDSSLDLDETFEAERFSTMFGHLSVASRAGVDDAWDIYGTHTPELIPLWAEGPGAEMVNASTDNTHLGAALLSMISGTARLTDNSSQPTPSGVGEVEPRNVILFVGDGMGLDAMTAAAYHGGSLAMRELPFRGLMATHAADRIVSDQASAATALATGRRTMRGSVGVGPDGEDLMSVLELGEARDMKTGIVSDGLVVGDSLAPFYTSGGEDVPSRRARLKDLLSAGMSDDDSKGVDVVFGHGSDGEAQRARKTLQKRDVGLATNWADVASGDGPSWALMPVNGGSTSNSASLASMTKEAIRRLSADNQAFFLVVESNRIGELQRSMNRDAAVPRAVHGFDRAVREGMKFARNDGQTLVVALGDRDYSLTVLDDHYGFSSDVCHAAKRCGGTYKMSEVGVDAQGLDAVEGFDDRGLQGEFAPPTLLLQYGWAEQEASLRTDGSIQGPATANFTPVFAGGPGASQLRGMIDQPDVGQYLVEWASQ